MMGNRRRECVFLLLLYDLNKLNSVMNYASGKKMTFYQDEILKYSLPRPSRNVWKMFKHSKPLYSFISIYGVNLT